MDKSRDKTTMTRKYLLAVELTRIFMVGVLGCFTFLYVGYVLPHLFGLWLRVGFWLAGFDIPVTVVVR